MNALEGKVAVITGGSSGIGLATAKLFQQAGVARFSPVSNVSEEAYDETFDINVKGVFFTIQKSHPFSARQRFDHSEHVVREPSRCSHDQRLRRE
jgi:NAD(P)-dependent dehydrogenase (short-subunit alcohol dehydrogenase family)